MPACSEDWLPTRQFHDNCLRGGLTMIEQSLRCMSPVTSDKSFYSSPPFLIPAAVLVGLASRILYQDRELAAKRAADQRRIAVDQLRRELDARLEAIKLQEINRLIRSQREPVARFRQPGGDLYREAGR